MEGVPDPFIATLQNFIVTLCTFQMTKGIHKDIYRAKM